MKRKIVFPALFCLALLLMLGLSTVSTQAQPEINIWGVSEGDTETYVETSEYKGTGSGKEVITYDIKIVKIDDFDLDNITDLVFTFEVEDGAGATLFLGTFLFPGDTVYDEDDLIDADILVPVAWVEATPSQLADGGLNWTAAIEAINTATTGPLVDYNATVDDDKLTIETATDRPHLYINGTDPTYASDYDVEETIKYNMKTGLLEEYTSVTTYNESYGLIIEEKITKGGPGIMDTLADNAIAIAAVGVAVLVLLIVLIKKE